MVKRISQRPQASFPKIIRSVYIRPRHTTALVNIFEIGMEKPMEAYVEVQYPIGRSYLADTYEEERLQNLLCRLSIIGMEYCCAC